MKTSIFIVSFCVSGANMKYIPNTINTTYKPLSNLVIPARPIDPIHHFKLVQRLGFPPGVKCWCGAELEFAPKEEWISRDRKRKAFFDEHEECEAKEVKRLEN